MFYSWIIVAFAFAAAFTDPGPVSGDEMVLTGDTAIVQEDQGTVEAMCCGPNEPPPPRPDE